MLDKLLLEYADLFCENFPVFAVRGSMTEQEMCETIKKCIKDQTPFQAENMNDVDY